jgi:hypothetical protein
LVLQRITGMDVVVAPRPLFRSNQTAKNVSFPLFFRSNPTDNMASFSLLCDRREHKNFFERTHAENPTRCLENVKMRGI